MAADGDAKPRGASLFGNFWRLPSKPLRAVSDARRPRCTVCCGHTICLRCGGRGQVLIVPMGWQAKPYIEDCPDCDGTGVCVDCGAASLN
jgi:hypothetical protein